MLPEETSKRITVLRFILSCMVIVFHNNKTILPILSDPALSFAQPAVWSHILQLIFHFTFALAPVPLFFAFSAYIQYDKDYAYPVLLKKRVSSILVPLFSWPALIIGGRILIKFACIKLFPDKVSSVLPYVDEWSAKDWLAAFFGDYTDVLSGKNFLCEPFVMPFYFIRDLFILVVLSPLIKKLVQKAPLAYGLVLAYMYFTNLRPVIVCVNAIFFYSLGFYFACYKLDAFKLADSVSWKRFAVLAAASFVYVMLTRNTSFCPIVSCLFYLKISRNLLNGNEKLVHALEYLSGFSFFLYAIHAPYFLPAFTKVWFAHVSQNCFTDLAEYFILSAVICACGTLIGILCRRFIPKLFFVLNGGR